MNGWISLALAFFLSSRSVQAPAPRGDAAQAPRGDAMQAPGSDAAQTTVADPARVARITAIEDEFEAATKAFRAAVAAAKTDEERVAIKGPDPADYAPRVWEVVRENPRDAAALEALTWLIEESKVASDRDQAIAAIAKDHLESKELGPLCAKLGGNQQIGTELLELLATSNPERTVRGSALYAIACHRLESARTARRLRGPAEDGLNLDAYKRWLGTERAAELAKADPVSLEADAERTLDRIMKEFGDVPWRDGTLAVRAEADLREMRELTIGKEAPDISGEDLDGVAFRLSDYRGKVVLLDFWGNW